MKSLGEQWRQNNGKPTPHSPKLQPLTWDLVYQDVLSLWGFCLLGGQKYPQGTSLVVQWLGLCGGGPGFDP